MVKKIKAKLQDCRRIIEPEPQWSSIAHEKLPLVAFADPSLNYPHHWVTKGKVSGETGRYDEGKLYIHKGGLIESYLRAQENGASAPVINHLKEHIDSLGIKVRERTAQQEAVAPLKLGEIKMNEGRLPEIGVFDLDRVTTEIDHTLARSGMDIENRELEVINSIARRDLKKSEIYTFPMYISNDLPDSYFTRMDPQSTLLNFVADLIETRGLMLAHGGGFLGGADASNLMPIGSSYHGELTTREGYSGNWTLGHYFILHGINIGGGRSTDDVIKQIDAGVYRRGSVGFTIGAIEGATRGWYKCEICGNNLMSADCEHLPGILYPAESGEAKICVARVMDGHMRESSLVYMNAAQGTVVQKAQRMAEEGQLDKKKILSLEMFYGVRFFDNNFAGNRAPEYDCECVDCGYETKSAEHCNTLKCSECGGEMRRKSRPGPGRSITVGDEEPGINNNEENEDMDTARAILISFVGGIREAIAPEGKLKKRFGDLNKSIEGAEEQADLDPCVEELREIVVEAHESGIANREIVGALPEEQRTVEGVEALMAKAADGDQYRSDLLTEALAEGVRAEGNDFDADHWRTALENEPLDFIKKQRDVWTKSAKATPGRKTEDGDGDKTYVVESKPGVKLPEKAFKTGKAHV